MTNLKAQCEAVYQKKVQGSITDVVRTVALESHTNIVLATPLGNPDLWAVNKRKGKKRGDKGYVGKGYVGGRARANWHISVNSIDRSVSNSTQTPDPMADAMKATEGLQYGDDVYLSNNLKYIKPLNNGHSTQAPASFVEKGVLLAKNRAKRNIKTTVSG